MTEEFEFLDGDNQSDVEIIEDQGMTDTGMLTLNISYQPPILSEGVKCLLYHTRTVRVYNFLYCGLS